MESQKVFVDENNQALLRCPQCEKAKRADLSSFKTRATKSLKVKCTCGLHFLVSLEFRISYRKQTSLEGTYVKLPNDTKKRNILVNNVSIHGIGFTNLADCELSLGERIKMNFKLDDAKQTEIEAVGVVKHITGSKIGCEFESPPDNSTAYGFYLMP